MAKVELSPEELREMASCDLTESEPPLAGEKGEKAALDVALDVLELCEGAIVDAVADEGGLDGADGLAVLEQAWDVLKAHGRDLMVTPDLLEQLRSQYGTHEAEYKGEG